MNIPFVSSPNFHWGRRRQVRVIVIHTMEAPEGPQTAENVARYFQRPVQASSHYCVDNDSIVQCVREEDTAWCAGGVNADGLHIEQAGYARQTPEEWADEYSRSMLSLSAGLCADLCLRHNIPARHLSNDELARGERGIIGHYQASRVYGGDHYDPGASFPWEEYINMVTAFIEGRDPNRKRGAEMALVQVNGNVYATDGLHRRHVRSMETVNAIKASTGIEVSQAGQGFLDDVPDIGAVTNRVREMKDLLTDYPGMDDTLKRTSILRQIAAKLGIEPRSK